jgi:hypothetical protein
MASTERRERTPGIVTAPRARPSLARTAVIALGLALGIFLLYFLAYPIRHLTLPVGFDPPWYVWRAERLTALGVGTGDLAARPGYPVLSAILGSLTGLSQLETTVVLSLVLVSLLALAVGALARVGLGLDRWRWAVVVAATGVVLGPTHLVGENLSNALNITLEIGAVTCLAAFIGGSRGMAAAVILLVASGLTHWDFVALFAVVMAVAFLMALPSSIRERERGLPAIRTGSGALAALGASVGGVLLVLVGGVLRAPIRTIEIGNDELLFRRKFRTDVARLIMPGLAGLVGPWALFPRQGFLGGEPEGRRHAFAVRLLRAWTYVMAAGMVVGLLTFALPPARFLAHLVALPGAITVGVAVAAVATWVRRRVQRRSRSRLWPSVASIAVVVLALASLAIPGVLRWYRYPVLLEPAAVQQARTADGYLRTLPSNRPVVFLVDYGGRPGSLSAILKERTIRMGISPERQLDAHIFVGTLPDLLAGRRTSAPDERAERFTRRYWNDVQPVLATRPPVVILRAMAQAEYRVALSMGGREVAPNVIVLRGPTPSDQITAASPPSEVPSLPAGILYGLLILILLWVAGAGWTKALLGGSPAKTVASLAPVTGAAVLIVGGLTAAELGVRLSLEGAVATYLAVSLSGLVAAVVETRAVRTSPSSTSTDSSSTRRSG